MNSGGVSIGLPQHFGPDVSPAARATRDLVVVHRMRTVHFLARKYVALLEGRVSPVSGLNARNLERAMGFEPTTPTLARLCSTPELHPRSLSVRRPGAYGVPSYAKRRPPLQQTRADRRCRRSSLRAAGGEQGNMMRIGRGATSRVVSVPCAGLRSRCSWRTIDRRGHAGRRSGHPRSGRRCRRIRRPMGCAVRPFRRTITAAVGLPRGGLWRVRFHGDGGGMRHSAAIRPLVASGRAPLHPVCQRHRSRAIFGCDPIHGTGSGLQ